MSIKSKTTAETKKSAQAIHDALTLDQNPEKLIRHYSQWAEDYDHDVCQEGYVAPNFLADYLNSINSHIDLPLPAPQDLRILDAGCGTGLVGIALKQRGYARIDGFDLSETMIGFARETGAYDTLHGGCDLNRPISQIEQDTYDVTLCCGVFTTGHVAPSALCELIRVTRPLGFIIVSTRKSYYESTPFQSTIAELERGGLIKQLDCVWEGPYLAEEAAHYWLIQAL